MYEAERYNSSLLKYESASLKTTTSLALLNFGQNAIFSGAIAIAMVLAAQEIMKGKFIFYFLFDYFLLTISSHFIVDIALSTCIK